jgi:tRNA1(Val) A37 N6-methylase TrmN6
MNEADVSQDALLGGRVHLLQPVRGHRAGTDAVLLAAAAAPPEGAGVADLGCASGAVGLMVGARVATCRLVFVDRDPRLLDLCRRNVAANGLLQRAEIIAADLLAPAHHRRQAGLEPGTCDLVVTNPPFLAQGQGRASPDPSRAAAHRLPKDGLAAWIAAARDLLVDGGTLILIHRADHLADCLAALTGFGAVVVKPVHPTSEAPATRILVSARKGRRSRVTIQPPLVLHEGARFTPAAEAIHRGEAVLDLT